MTATITNNTIDQVNNGIRIVGLLDGVGTFLVSNNILTDVGIVGIYAVTGTNPGDASDLAFTAINNTIDVEYYGDGMSVQAEQSGLVCANLVGNIFNDIGGGDAGIRVIQQTSTATFQLERLVGNPTSEAVVETQLLVDNPNDGGIGHIAQRSTNFTGVIAGTCRTP